MPDKSYSRLDIDADELCSVDNLEPAPKMQRTYQEQEGARPKKRARRGKGNAAVEGQLHYMEMIGGQLDPSDSPTTSTDALVTMSAHHPGTRVQFPRMGSTGWENAQDQTISISPQDKAAVDSQIIMTGGLQPDYQHPLMALPIVGNHLYNANQLPMNMGHVPQIQSLPWYVSSPAAAGQASYGI